MAPPLIALLFVVVIGAAVAFFVLAGGGEALRHTKHGDLGAEDEDRERPEHLRVSTHEQAEGYGLPADGQDPSTRKTSSHSDQ